MNKRLLALLGVFLCSALISAKALDNPEICNCRYEVLYAEGWEVWFGCWSQTGTCTQSCSEVLHTESNTFRCKCNSGGWEVCKCYGQTVYAGNDPETVCINAGCTGTNVVCQEPNEDPNSGYFIWCNCRS